MAIELKNCFEDGYSLEKYLSEKAENHNSYKIYDTEERITCIAVDKKLYLSDGSKWNDENDSKAMNSCVDGYKYFARCFTYSISENVAMWMLYGGLHHKGAMIDIGRAKLTKIKTECKQAAFGKFKKEGGFKAETTVEKKDFQLYLTDILYYAPSKDNDGNIKKGLVDVKRSDETLRDKDENIIKDLNFKKKYYAWNYENECRLILKIKEELCRGCTDVEIDFHEINFDNDFVIVKAPNFTGPPICNEKYYAESKLKGQLNWNLCKGCCED